MPGWSTISTFAEKGADAGKSGRPAIMRMPGETFVQRKCETCGHEDQILETLHKKDHLGLLHQLQDLDRAEATALLQDGDLLQEIRGAYDRAALWALFTALFFGGQMPVPQRELALAFSSKNITEAMDTLALIIFNHGVDTYAAKDVYWQVLEQAVLEIFTGNPRLVDLFKMVIHHDAASVMPKRLDFTSSEVHFEPAAGGGAQLELFTNQARQTVYATTSELRVIVTIYFVDGNNPANPYYFRGQGEAGLPDKWKSEIESVWSNRFELDNGVHKLKLSVSPRFTFDRPQADQAVVIMNDKKRKCRGSNEPGRSFENCWFTDAGKMTIAHEFGHMIGAVDEYNLPGSERDISGTMRNKLTREELERTTASGIYGFHQKPGTYTMPGLMGDMGSTEIKARNIQALVSAYNAGLPPNTPPYRVKKI